MKAVGVIPARYASTRFPGKPLVDLCGKPMIQRVWEQARKARSLSEVLIATDDKRIALAVRAFGGKAVMTPASCATGTDRIACAVRGMKAGLVVNIQGDEPLLDPSCIDQLVALLKRHPAAGMATLCHEIKDPKELGNPNSVKVVMDGKGKALYFSRAPIPFPRQIEGFRPAKHIGLYAYRLPFLRRFVRLKPSPLEKLENLEQLRALENGYAIQVGWSKKPSQAVDTPADAARVRKILLQKSRL